MKDARRGHRPIGSRIGPFGIRLLLKTVGVGSGRDPPRGSGVPPPGGGVPRVLGDSKKNRGAWKRDKKGLFGRQDENTLHPDTFLSEQAIA